MFGYNHYVAWMRTKPAELRALRELERTISLRITPVLECVPRTVQGCESLRDVEEKVENVINHLGLWSGRQVFFDFELVRSMTPRAVELMAARAVLAGILPVMAVSMKTSLESPYSHSIQRVLARHGGTLCLRVSAEELKGDSIDEMIEERLKRFGAPPSQVHLIVEQGRLYCGSVLYQEFAGRIPWVDSWNTLTVLAGSFPKDLSDLSRGCTHRLPRFEWQQWRDLAKWPARRPAFGDYTIQHAYFEKPVSAPNVSASIRYTLDDHFFVMRGENIQDKSGPGYQQWNAWASLLIEKSEYFGAAFSAGDRYIAEHAVSGSNTGNPQTWLQAGFSHHLTTVALQVVGRLGQMRSITAAAAAPDWNSIAEVERPEAAV